jgi:bis(5'-nucleosyl)-tetraphosphatase (symmetrical)
MSVSRCLLLLISFPIALPSFLNEACPHSLHSFRISSKSEAHSDRSSAFGCAPLLNPLGQLCHLRHFCSRNAPNPATGRSHLCILHDRQGREQPLTRVFRPHGGARLLSVARSKKLKDADVGYMDERAAQHIVLPEEEERKRIIIIGDVHGCYDELCQLLEKAQFESGKDTLILAGDFVNKGPKSAHVVRLARQLGARAVVGNHELLSLRARAVMDYEDRACRLTNSKYAWTAELSSEDLSYLRGLPYTIRLPRHHSLIVHAGLIPGQPLNKQHPLSLVTTRNLVLERDDQGLRESWLGTTDTARGVPWAARWHGPEHVYFGHSTRRSVQQRLLSTGLDTGCVYGGSLSAAVLNAMPCEGEGPPPPPPSSRA